MPGEDVEVMATELLIERQDVVECVREQPIRTATSITTIASGAGKCCRIIRVVIFQPVIRTDRRTELKLWDKPQLHKVTGRQVVFTTAGEIPAVRVLVIAYERVVPTPPFGSRIVAKVGHQVTIWIGFILAGFVIVNVNRIDLGHYPKETCLCIGRLPEGMGVRNVGSYSKPVFKLRLQIDPGRETLEQLLAKVTLVL